MAHDRSRAATRRPTSTALVLLLVVLVMGATIGRAPAPVEAEPMPGLYVKAQPTTSTQVLPAAGTPLSTVSRDCGFSITLSNQAALWVYCDSTDAPVSGGGSLTYFVNNTAALAYPNDPYTMREPWAPNGAPHQFIVPDEAPYHPCGAGERHVAWPISGTRAGGGPNNDRVIIYYENICQNTTTLANRAVSTGVAEWWYDTTRSVEQQLAGPIRAMITQPNLFPRPAGGTPWGVGAVDGRDGYVYVQRCNAGDCGVARAPIGSFGTASAYQGWNGSAWTAGLPATATAVQFLGAGPYSAVHVQWVEVARAFVMTSWNPTTGRHVAVFAAGTANGPWTRPTEVLIPGCDPSPVPPHGKPCYHATVHEHLSKPGPLLAIGIHDAITDRNGTLRANHRVALVPVSTAGLTGSLESVTTPTKGKVRVAGWAVERNTTQPVAIHVYAGSQGLGATTASIYRADVKALFPDLSGNSGFDASFDAPLGPQKVCAYMIRTVGPGGNSLLGCRDVFVPDPASPFLDVLSTQQFFADIVWLLDQGITTGNADGTFRPGAPVQRMAMAAFLYRLAGEPAFTPPATSPFTDVPTDHPFYDEITWLASTGITTGYPDGTFRPTGAVQRQAMAAFLYRLAGEPAFTPPGTSPFTDVPTAHPFYLEITWLASTGITTGFPDGTFRGGAAVARQAMAAFLHRYDDAGLPILPPG